MDQLNDFKETTKENESKRVYVETREAVSSIVSFLESIDFIKLESTLKLILGNVTEDLVIMPQHDQEQFKIALEKIITARDKFVKSGEMVRVLAAYQAHHFKIKMDEMVNKLHEDLNFLENEHALINQEFEQLKLTQ